VKAFETVGIRLRSAVRFFTLELAREIKRRHGSTLYGYCNSADEKASYDSLNKDGLFAEIIDASHLKNVLNAKTLPHSAELVSTARSYEQRFGTTYNCLSVSNRHFGRGYALGGFYHPRSRISEETSYDNLLHNWNETLSFWDKEFTTRGLTLLIDGSREASVVARHHGVPMRIMAGSRHKNYHYWAWNEYYENPEFDQAFGEISDVELYDMKVPYDSHMANRGQFIKEMTASRLLFKAGRDVARHVWWKYRGYAKAKGYYLSENLAYYGRIYAQWRQLNRSKLVSLKDLEGAPYVYFPLHVEPEIALQGLSPEYFYQLSAIAALARDLPAGYKLAVKETFGAVGRRPRDFYAQIAEFKHVVMLYPLELGINCVRNAAAVATISGTAGFEGAVMGRPVVTFGRHNIYNFVPHVRVIEQETQLQSHLADCLSNHDVTTARQDGSRFLAAVVARSFDLRDYDYRTPAYVPDGVIPEAYAALERGLHSQRNPDV
jgi:hypothetical protein